MFETIFSLCKFLFDFPNKFTVFSPFTHRPNLPFCVPWNFVSFDISQKSSPSSSSNKIPLKLSLSSRLFVVEFTITKICESTGHSTFLTLRARWHLFNIQWFWLQVKSVDDTTMWTITTNDFIATRNSHSWLSRRASKIFWINNGYV